MAGVDFLHVEFAQAFCEGSHLGVRRSEQMKSAKNRVNLFAGECRLDFFYDVVGSAVAATVHDEQALGRVEYQALLMVETVGAVLAVFLDGEVGAEPNGGAACGIQHAILVAHDKYAGQNFRVAIGKANAVGVALQGAATDANVFLVRDDAENLVRVVAVFEGRLAQVKRGMVVCFEECSHAVCVVVMRMA